MPETEQLRYERLSVNDGLCHSSIYSILQDKKGFMWFAGRYGISKYDGHNFKNYFTMTDSINTESVTGIFSSYEDSIGDIWFGSWNGELIRYNNEKDYLEYWTISKDIEEPYFRNIIYFICEDKSDNLWLETRKSGLVKFNKNTKEFSTLNFPSINTSTLVSFAVINDSEAALLDEDSLHIVNLEDGTSVAFDIKPQRIKYDLKGQYLLFVCFRIFRYSESVYFLLTLYGLVTYNHLTKEIKQFDLHSSYDNDFFSKIDFMSFDNSGKLWFGLYNGDFCMMDLDTKQISHLSCDFEKDFKTGVNRISYFYIDKSGVMWISVTGLGLYKMDTIRKKFHHLKVINDSENKINNIYKLYVDSNNYLFIGTRNNGVFKLDTKKCHANQYKTSGIKDDCLSTQVVEDMFKDKSDNFWVGTSDGIYKYIEEADEFEKYLEHGSKQESRIYGISDYHDENDIHYLLMLTTNSKGITRIETKNKSLSDFTDCYKIVPEIKNMTVSSLYSDKEHNLWICASLKTSDKVPANRNIYKLSLKNHSCKIYRSEMVIHNIYEDSKNNIWFCSDGALLKYNRKDETFTKYPVDINGRRKIYYIEEDNYGNIWFSTLRALFKLNPETKEYREYDYFDGLSNKEVISPTICRDNNGVLYFGGTNGIDYFHPLEIKDNPYIPNVVITDFQIFNKTIIGSEDNPFLKKNITYAEEINLTHKENVFSFSFAALVYNRTQKNQYAYKMAGFDHDWTYSGNRRRVTYTNLDPGEYIFRVKGSNNDGVWNEEGTSVKITITPPYWKKWWFKGLGLLSLAAATGLTYKGRLDKIEKERKDQEEFSRKLIESQENERKRIASELHDTIAHEVLIAKNKADIGLKHLGEMDKVENTLKEISELSSATIKDVRNISYNLHPHQLERLGFTKTIRAIVNDVKNSTDIDFSFESDTIDGHLTKESEINLFRVIQESINNMIKHSDADKAEVKLLVSDNYILVILKDNGKGISSDKKDLQDIKGGFGLSGMKERIKYMKGEIHIESEENKGTSIIIRIPMKV